ncbi:hypothetical protein HBI56_233770 [Parastagonospora nodorum]|uniref:Uncharacterized protein n=1 Tax=Phaeosphaeria nodorum (strain SN15 / ATCC MYA-4574 / FGSC 10173) TaxID=321614 RepID=A0A7U2I7Y3_PHANO|nr:hypothetical protein HBH56_247910 [Parastagonospora nodorum]QRD03757.1 hypothetical protein JI435_420200 [Parastagonospora nodorum SN15]KAH3921241.1 hypothetical protein HBH54_242800 [Parastagonospora nodorum]KAH3939009.1 hypothetical protein HBH53_240730 [Parastagonospora nodorum]KAH3968407.1 hypothetical protein HBH52_181870 [Parastagonospora nodorum]
MRDSQSGGAIKPSRYLRGVVDSSLQRKVACTTMSSTSRKSQLHASEESRPMHLITHD